MTQDEQLAWEVRSGRPAAAAAFGAAFLSIAGTIWSQAAVSGTDGTVEFVKKLDEQAANFIAGAVIQSIAILLVAVPLVYLFQATAYRRPETPRAALYLAIAGPVFVAVIQILQSVLYVNAARDVVHLLPLADTDADDKFDDLRREGALAVVGGVGIGAGLALAFSFVLINLNAMRAGLLSRFMGIVGIILGVLYVLPQLGPPAIIQLFWLTALGMLFLGRWPGGRGPAWETGEADSWPTAADRRAEMEAARGGDDDVEEAEEEARAEEAEEDAEAEPVEPDAKPHPRSKKRKRKRRR